MSNDNTKHDDDKRESEELCAKIIGMPYEQAKYVLKSASKSIRVYKKDGHYLMCTRDYRINRVNVGLVDDIVVDAHIG